MNSYLSEMFVATIGVVPGYHHANQGGQASDTVLPLWAKYMEEEFVRSKIVVSAIVQDAKLAYPAVKGCPEDGEKIAVLTGSYRQTDNYTCMQWKESAIAILDKVRQELQQVTARIDFTKSETFYLK